MQAEEGFYKGMLRENLAVVFYAFVIFYDCYRLKNLISFQQTCEIISRVAGWYIPTPLPGCTAMELNVLKLFPEVLQWFCSFHNHGACDAHYT